MKLLEYLEPMKTLPNRFSNLAFWRILRVFKDDVVDAFTYVDTWGKWVEDEQVSQNNKINSHENSISSIQKEQISQNESITANTNGISDIWTSVGNVNTDLDALKKLVFDASSNFKITTYTDMKGTVKNIVDSLYAVQTNNPWLELTTVPFHVVVRAYISIFTNSEHTSTANISIPMSHVVTINSGKTRVLMSPTPFYAPYGVNNLTGVYITYLSHV